MRLNDFYSEPDVPPVRFSDTFLEENKKELLAHQKNFKIIYHPFFKTKRFFYLAQAHLRKKFFIGQVSAGLGDLVLYSHLPRLIKSHFRGYQVFVYESDMSRIVFANNPYINGFTKDKRMLWNKKGSGVDYGSGHLTQMKARFLGIKKSLPRGELYINAEEKSFASVSKPIATIHAHGKTISSPISDEIWAAIVKELQRTHHVIQLKSTEENIIEGVEQIVSGIRECIVQQSVANIHVGIDSGFTHTAAALDVPTVVILDRIGVNRPLLQEGVHQLVLPQLRGRHLNFLYPQHTYLCVGPSTPKTPSLTRRTLRMAINGEIYPFRKQIIWNRDLH